MYKYILFSFFICTICKAQNYFFNKKINSTDDLIWTSFEDKNQNCVFVVEKHNTTSNHSSTIAYKTDEDGVLLDSLTFAADSSLTIYTSFSIGDSYIFIGNIQESNKAKIYVSKTDINFNILSTATYKSSISNYDDYPMYASYSNDSIFITGYTKQQDYQEQNGFVYVLNQNLDSLTSKYFSNSGYQFYWDLIKIKNEYRLFFDDFNKNLNVGETGGYTYKLNNNLEPIDSFRIYKKAPTPDGYIPYTELVFKKNAAVINDSIYLLSGRFNGSLNVSPDYPFQRLHGVFKINVNKKDTIEKILLLGKIDTVNYELKKAIDFKYKNNIYIGTNTQMDDPVDFTKFKNNYGLVTKVDDNLNIIWQKYIGGDAFYIFQDICATSDYGVLISGQAYNPLINTTYERDIVVFKLDSAGNVIKTVGIDSNAKKNMDLTVYPNPTKNTFTISNLENGNYLVEAIDLIGKTIYSEKFTTIDEKIIINNIEKEHQIIVLRVTNIQTKIINTFRLLIN